MPFRDFWEHHTPLAWFVFAPFSLPHEQPRRRTRSSSMRWAQIPVWIATFWLANVWMRNAGLSTVRAVGVDGAGTLQLFLHDCRPSSIASTRWPALLVMAGLVLMQRGDRRGAVSGRRLFLPGRACEHPPRHRVLIVAVLFAPPRRPRRARGGGRSRANWIFAGAHRRVSLALGYFAATHSLDAFIRQVFVENSLGDKYAHAESSAHFVHRLLVPFGVRLLQTDRVLRARRRRCRRHRSADRSASSGCFCALTRWRMSGSVLRAHRRSQIANLLVDRQDEVHLQLSLRVRR